MKKKFSIFATQGIMLCVYAGLSFFMSSIIDEDAFIYFRCAENILQGNGYVFNPGGEHIEACSSVPWLYMLVLAGWLGCNIIISVKILGLLCGAVSLILIYKITQAFTDEMPWVIAPSFLTLMTPPFIMWNQMGLETALSMAVLLSLILISLNKVSFCKYGPLAAAVLITTRPEGFFLLLGLLPAVYLYRNSGKELMKSCAVFFAIALLLALLRFYYFHDFFPNPFYHKISPGKYRLGLSYLHRCFCDYYVYYALIPLSTIFFNKENWKGKRLILFGFILSYLCWILLAGTDYKPLYRYLVPAFPLWYIYIISGMTALPVQHSRRTQVLAGSFVLLFACAVLFFSPITWYFEEPLPNFFLSKLRQFAVEPKHYMALCFKRMTDPAAYDYNDRPDKHVLLGEFIGKNYKAGSTVVYDQMGRVPYFAGTKINFIDSNGLTDKIIGRAVFYYKCSGNVLLRLYEAVSRRIIKTVYPGYNNAFFTKEALMNYVFDKHPDVIMCFAPMSIPVITMMAADSRFNDNYKAKYLIAGVIIFERRGLAAKPLYIPEGLTVGYERDIYKDPSISRHPLVSATKKPMESRIN